MTNFERNKEKIKEVCKQKRIKYSLLCDWLNCQGCDHYEDPDYICVERALLWLSEDDGSPSPDRIAGQNEAWELAQRIAKDECSGGLSTKEREEIFKSVSCRYPIIDNTYAEAAEKVRAWEESKNLKIGVVVKNKEDGCIGVITGLDYDCSLYSVITDKGYSKLWYTYDCTETGRTLPVKDWLRQIGG